MKQIKFYLIQQIQLYFVCLLLTLSIHTAYSSESRYPIFTKSTIFGTPQGVALICKPHESVKDFKLLKFEITQTAAQSTQISKQFKLILAKIPHMYPKTYLIASYQGSKQIIAASLNPFPLDVENSIIDDTNSNTGEVQIIFPVRNQNDNLG